MHDALEGIGIDSQPLIEQKLKTLDELDGIAQHLRQQRKSIVTNNGSYDILHIGHVISLMEAARQGDVLIVGINSDLSVRQNKGPDRPINPQGVRMRMLAALACVDYVFVFDEPDPIVFLDRLRPNVHTNGSEYGLDCIERPVVERHGGHIHLLPMVRGFSTTQMIERIHQADKDDSA